MDKYTLITGSSSGIGKAMAEYCAGLGMNLLLVSLPNEKLGEVAFNLADKHKVKVRFFEIDLTLANAPEALCQWVIEEGFNVNILINNAGVAGASLFDSAELKYIDERIQLNVRATVLLTRLFIPLLKKHAKSYVLNVSSLAGFYAIPYKTIYSASKAFILHFSKAVKYELKQYNISVSVLCPSGVSSNGTMHKRMKDHTVFARWVEVSTEEVARTAVDGMLKRKFLIIPGIINRIVLNISKLLPDVIKEKYIVHEYRKEVKSLKDAPVGTGRDLSNAPLK